ncbi:MAG: methyltransferase domain-containing protein [Lentisphaerota bacterium]
MDYNEIERVYRQRFEGARRLVQNEDNQWLYLLKQMPATREVCILDAGCGDGAYALKLAHEGYPHVQAIDLFDRLETEQAFIYTRASIDATPFLEGYFDLIYSFSVIFYLQDPVAGLKEFYRILRPGGILVLSMHTKYSLFTLDRIVRRALGRAEHLNGVRFYSAGAYKDMLQCAGFKVMDVDGFGLFYSPRNVINRICHKLGGRFHGPDTGLAPFSAWRKMMKWFRATTGYHMLIAARKPGEDATHSQPVNAGLRTGAPPDVSDVIR